MVITFRYYNPKPLQLLGTDIKEIPDDLDEYELGKIYADKLQPYIEDNKSINMTAESTRAVHRFKVIHKNAGALVIEEK